MADITFQYPAWYFIFCLLLGGAYAFILYYKDDTFKNASAHSRRLLYGLSFLRFIVVSFVAFLLMAPLLRSTFTEEEEPIVVVVQDQSASIPQAWQEGDSAAYIEQMNALVEGLTGQYRVETFSFGDDVGQGIDYSFEDKSTDISQVFDQLYNLYTNQNLGAVILASDGIYNQGSNPLYAQNMLNVPVFTVALGDTVPKKDLKIRDVQHNRIAYLDDKFEVRINAAAQNAAGGNSRVTITEIIADGADRELFNESFSIPEDDFAKSWSVNLEAKETGLRHYRAALSPLDGEITNENNYFDFFVDILDSRQKILLLANAPHPDITAIRQALDNNKNYEVDIRFFENLNESLDQYNLVVLHQLPSETNAVSSILNELEGKNISTWYIAGNQSSISDLNRAQNTVNIRNTQGSTNDAQATLNKNFVMFQVPEGMEDALGNYPPLKAPYGEYQLSSRASVMLLQKIGSVVTDYPLLAMDQSSERKVAVLAGEGIWRWRLHNFLRSNDHRVFDEFISKVVQFMSVKEDKRKFRVTMPKNIFNENEAVAFNAELYDDNFELVNDPEVSITILDEESREYPFNFNRTGNAYTLNAGHFNVGSYTYTATTNFNDEQLTHSGQFSVRPVKLEALQTTANHRLLHQLATQSGGQMLYPSELANIQQIISSQEQIRPVLHETEETRAFINLKWLFFILLALLGMEWFLRKYNGAY